MKGDLKEPESNVSGIRVVPRAASLREAAFILLEALMLDTRYDHLKVEAGKYDSWKKEGRFVAKGGKKPFSLVIPPPNVTGKLHLGHVMDTIPMDIIARYKRLQGYDVLWVPGVDHAGIATQAKVEAKLREEGISRYDLGREKFLEKAWEWKNEYTSHIHDQWKALGLSVDYTRERFTLDEGLNKAVRKVFVDLYKEGLIYRGERITNWDPVLRTALSNIEVIHKDIEGEFYYFSYDVAGTEEQLIVATTRPETMFGDVAVFVNPKDERFRHLIGKKCKNPANGDWLPIMGDEYVDISFGTGAMKCTPAHDPNDFNLARKYQLPLIKVLDEEARLVGPVGDYRGLDRFAARERLVEEIKRDGHLVKIEKIVHSVGHSERSNAIVEPMLSKQWFVKMQPLAERLLAFQKSKEAIEFIPKRFKKTLERWMEGVEDWCVSRQLWWGHRIPAYYHKETGEILVTEKEVDLNVYDQDEDVLDTWFSSGLWPFATLGWPDTEKPDFKRYFPTSVLVTGYDIIFFWVARMSFQSLHFTNEKPFRKVLIHGLIRDEKGRKMSKSLGNGVDPLDVIEKYGTDALRYFITTNTAPGLDMRYSEEKVLSSKNYLNKIWNSCRYVEMALGEDYVPQKLEPKNLGVLDRAILSKLSKTIRSIVKSMNAFKFNEASKTLYDFVYEDFCSSYLEMSKVALNGSEEEKKGALSTLFYVMKSVILMIYPYAPFIAEEMYLSLPGHKGSIMEETYPKALKAHLDMEAERKLSLLEETISASRAHKVRLHLAPNKPIKIKIGPKFPFAGFDRYLRRFAFASEVTETESLTTSSLSLPDGYSILIEEEIDKETLVLRLRKEEARLLSEIERSRKMLDNPNFVKKAPEGKILSEREKLSSNERLLMEARRKLEELE